MFITSVVGVHTLNRVNIDHLMISKEVVLFTVVCTCLFVYCINLLVSFPACCLLTCTLRACQHL
jgi:hypothetical protein